MVFLRKFIRLLGLTIWIPALSAVAASFLIESYVLNGIRSNQTEARCLALVIEAGKIVTIIVLRVIFIDCNQEVNPLDKRSHIRVHIRKVIFFIARPLQVVLFTFSLWCAAMYFSSFLDKPNEKKARTEAEQHINATYTQKIQDENASTSLQKAQIANNHKSDLDVDNARVNNKRQDLVRNNSFTNKQILDEAIRVRDKHEIKVQKTINDEQGKIQQSGDSKVKALQASRDIEIQSQQSKDFGDDSRQPTVNSLIRLLRRTVHVDVPYDLVVLGFCLLFSAILETLVYVGFESLIYQVFFMEDQDEDIPTSAEFPENEAERQRTRRLKEENIILELRLREEEKRTKLLSKLTSVCEDALNKKFSVTVTSKTEDILTHATEHGVVPSHAVVTPRDP